jgi:LCP family protein required for cell wall assembly
VTTEGEQVATTGPAAPGPAWQRQRSGRRLARLLGQASVATSALLIALVGAAFVLYDRYDGNITRLPGIIDAEPPEGGADRDDRPLNLLVVGSDSREGLTGEEAFQGTGDEFITGERADVVILVHLFASGRTAQLVSLPRDTFVEIPAHQDPKTGATVPARQDRLNTAFARGGPQLLVATVQQLTGVRLQHYVQVDFRGFKSLVDQVGGVEVCLTEPQKDFRSGIDLPAGRQTVQGEQALAFVRQRSGLARGDIDRIRRQQLLLGALVREVLSAGTLLNPVKLNGVLSVATTSLQVDDTLSTARLRDLALRVRGLDPGSFVFTTAPVADLDARRRGASVVLLDPAESGRLFDRLRRDIPPPPPPPGAPEPPDQRTAAETECA